MEAIQHHLKKVNNENDVSNDELYAFLKHFYLLPYDLGKDYGVTLSLLHSHISQFQQQYPQSVWSRVVDIVQTRNQNAGTVTPDNLPEDLKNVFRQKSVKAIPEELKVTREIPPTDWAQHTDATHLAFALLIGSWNEKNKNDVEVVTHVLGLSYEDWLKKAREILHLTDSPLTLKNGIWKVTGRAELLSLLGTRVFDQNLESFKTLAVKVLSEIDPSFELPAEERYLASIHRKVPRYSETLRKGVAEGLAIIGSFPSAFSNCLQEKAESISSSALCEILSDADWRRWGSLNNLLPTLAEAHPGAFLSVVEQALCLTPCPFDELFSQEGNGSTGRNYLTGLLWALEGLAWDEQYLVRVCVVLGELASKDPGGQSGNRPANSLSTILLPWLPQTLASVKTRKAAMRTLINEWPDVAWNLIIQLLPGQIKTSFGSHKPSWRKIIPDDREKGVTDQEYWQQAKFYAELSVSEAVKNTSRITTLIDNFQNLPQPAFDQFIKVLSSKPIVEISEDQRLTIWEHLTKLINRHCRYPDAKWSLPEELMVKIEEVSEKFEPTDPLNLYQHLFTDRGFDLYDENGDWKEQQKQLTVRRENAISAVYHQKGVEGVIRFAESVASPRQVGHALGGIDDAVFEGTFFPNFLSTEDTKHKAVVSSFILRRFYVKHWDWCDGIDKSSWSPAQIGQFLTCLPFTKETWNRASEWLKELECEYWTRAGADAYQTKCDLPIAIEKLIEHRRPHAAINCLDKMRFHKQPINTDQCVQALLAALSSNEASYAMDGDAIVDLIKLLQADPSVNEDELFKIEWAYLHLLNCNMEAAPQLLENRLANDPKLFCEVIRLIYRSKKEDQFQREPTEESRAIATNAWRLLHEWKTPPGTQKDGTFNEESFAKWLQDVKASCTESGHLEVALIHVGNVLIHTPEDQNGLWINRVVAAALNDRDAEAMRRGFRTETCNSRGVYWVDPTGETEKALAEGFRAKAKKVENEGFQRLTDTLRDVVNVYDKEAERIISESEKPTS